MLPLEVREYFPRLWRHGDTASDAVLAFWEWLAATLTLVLLHGFVLLCLLLLVQAGLVPE
jgi:hypothetical protein